MTDQEKDVFNVLVVKEYKKIIEKQNTLIEQQRKHIERLNFLIRREHSLGDH